MSVAEKKTETQEDLDRKKKKEEKAREKELKKLKAAEKAAKLKAQQESSNASHKSAAKKNAKRDAGGDENPEDYVDPKLPMDTIIRWWRISGYNTLWVPGVDHAGIATQVVVEKKLMRERHLNRHDIGREKFVSEGGLGEIVVATTRLETMLGDTAIAIHPDDKRYSHLHGKFAIHPFNGRKLPIICDAVLVDPNCGTGAVKITPAHDPNDFEVRKRHNLEFVNIFTDDDKINSNGVQSSLGSVFQGPGGGERSIAEKGLYGGAKNNEMRLGCCSRSNDVVEPMIKPSGLLTIVVWQSRLLMP
ncbi:hypothetical protein GH714_005566 [Hevea brasiliensis]|uniref:valine--tRNA ligase n=1 Tax=Hevea brasiliensis TaxID=3981 RepID=A0A6A6MD76_HEVBR|nr:hypothetical protein GH714_005566 [Hevea brasiliensis]